MRIYEAILLGFVQGFCEFLPVSSSGHLLLFQKWLGVTDGGLFFDVILHLGTLIPVFLIFKKDVFELFRKPYKNLRFLVLATIPAVVTGFVFSDVIDGLFYTDGILSACLLSLTFLLTALELLVAQKIVRKRKNFSPLSNGVALNMGIGQALAIVPGLSRSGTVISFGAFSGLDTEKTATFAFLMSIPIILGATILSGIKAIVLGESVQILPVLFGVVSSAVTGYLAITVMLRVIKKANYYPFCIYLIFTVIASLISGVMI